MRWNAFSTKSTPCWSVIQKRVIRTSVIGRAFAPSAILRSKKGTTEPLRRDDIAIADDGEFRPVGTRVGVGRAEKLVGGKFGCAIEIDRICSFVGRQRDDLAHASAERRLNDILRAMHIGLQALDGIVLGQRDMLHGGSMDDVVHVLHRQITDGPCPDIAKEKPQTMVVLQFFLHQEVLLLVAREYYDARNASLLQQSTD